VTADYKRTEAESDDLGYRGPAACSVAGITYRQLDYWARTLLVTPTIRSASGCGSQRLYSLRDVLLLTIVKRLLETGVSLQSVRAVADHLRDRSDVDLSGVTLMSDGARVYECTSADEVTDLVQCGRGVFAVAVGRVARDVQGLLAGFPAERADEMALGASP